MSNETKSKKIKKAVIAGCIVLVLAAAAGLYLYNSANRIPEVKVVSVGRGDVSQVLELTGTIESEDIKTYYAEVGSIVLEFDLEKGDDVKKGDRILSYDTYDYETALEKAQISDRITGLDIDDAEGYNGRKSDRYDEAQRMMDERIVWINNRKDDLDRYQEDLIEEQASSSPDAKKISRLQFDIQEATSDIQEMKQQLTAATNTRDAAKEALISDEKREQLELSDDLAGLSVQDIERDLKTARAGIVALSDGVVTETYIKSGAAIAKGQPVLTVASAEDVCVRLEVGQKDLANIAIGQKAVITSVSRKYDGTVDRISRSAAKNNKDKQVVSVYVHIDEPDEYIIIDMEAKAKIDLGSAKGVLVVPSETLHDEDDDTYCYVLEDGEIRKRRVETGLAFEGKTQITEGLNEGEMLLLALPEVLDEGDAAAGVIAGE